MPNYQIRNYQKGFEQDQARIGAEVARNWIWPYAYDLDDLLKISAQPEFDPDTRHYCFLDDEMVGYLYSLIQPTGEDGVLTATLEYPRILPGHEQAAAPLMEWAFKILKEKGVSRVSGRVTTMCPGDIELAERMGFAIRDWGYKIYYHYEMGWGRLNISGVEVEEVDPEVDLEEISKIAANWYKRPAEWCLNMLRQWHEWGVITHLGIREAGKYIAACMAAPNVLRPSTAANYYIYTPDEVCLRPLLSKVIDRCINYGACNLIADLVYDHRKYEPVYEQLGFKKVAEWARCEKILY